MRLVKSQCFECAKGTLEPTITARSFTIDGHRVRIPGLVVLVCNRCGDRSWPESELERGRQLAAIKRSAEVA